MKSQELERWLRKEGMVMTRPAKGGHIIYTNPASGAWTIVPRHSKELSKGTVAAIKKHLGLK